MSRHATDWAWETDPGSSSLKLILLSMADRADEYNLCYPSIERLVKDTCLNKKTVQAGLISLMKMGLISDTGERKGATKRVRVFSLNITKNGNIKGNREGGNEPENGNVTENGNIPKNGMLNDPKNGMLNDPKNGMLNDPKNGIQNQSYNQSFNQERESRTKSGDSVPHDPGANNAVMNNFVPPGGLGQLGKFVMHEQWQPSDDFLRKSSLQGIYLDSLPTAQELAEFRIYWMAEGKAYHQAQWEQKLARRLQISRQKQSTLPDNNVPHWNSPEAWEDFL
ncbi:TPA: helix-turn-helix domain-containing protein [Escherichia albertii]|uniref:DnaT-like ssDNA-binding domain-containing protein n=1 Tax=Escherichia albertii TaxID=208962 RepID=UPI0022311ED3|nr:DnaT-like ssDNA-binding domain-containing protein [Escherichia albertii]MCW3798972.1 DnaT-like ssDNA-binding domain-containing protein [Escherichia albertii]WOA27855.1 DnaT-like ssDNA-binding domain-containing protein [Escherichia albertii]HEB1148356.1 helix-turn-helix domain-containing protein [Escherichia albertii]HEB1186656.1 helix-turn-helix domain-containing protein [Escherichia albertii]HEB1581274.1 helix-turn-helix domain-containing protein [Escherichia albertii]